MHVGLAVDQALHGYDNGHRLLASSAKLDRSSAAAMREMSDLAAALPSGPRDSYLSGYPLPTARAYVFATTWAAPEISRPGAAWTHSLLISFDDIPKIESAVGISNLFCRPGPDVERSTYERSLNWTDASPAQDGDRADWPPAVIVLDALYGTGRPVIVQVDAREAAADREGVLRIWSQQWPSLRRAFKFRTLGRTGTATSFDLILMPTRTPMERHTEPHGKQLQSLKRPEWLVFLLADLSRPVAPLRRFLLRYGSDAANPRTAFPLLVASWLWLRGLSDDVSWVGLLAARPPDDLSRLRKDVLSLGVDGDAVSPGRLGRLLWAAADLWPDAPAPQIAVEPAVEDIPEDHGKLSDMLDQAAKHGTGTLAYYAVGIAVRNCRRTTLLNAIGERLSRLETADAMLPDLLLDDETWTRPAIVKWLIRHMQVSSTDTKRVMELALASDDVDADDVVNQIGSEAIGRWLSSVDEGRRPLPDDADPWLRAALGREDMFVRSLATSSCLNAKLLDRLSQACLRHYPETLLNAEAWNAATTGLSRTTISAHPDLRAQLFHCALHAHSPVAEDLFAKTFESMHDDLASQAVPAFPFSPLLLLRWGWEWDRCLGLRSSLAKAFVQNRLDPHQLRWIISNKKVLADVIALVRCEPLGEDYLRNWSSKEDH